MTHETDIVAELARLRAAIERTAVAPALMTVVEAAAYLGVGRTKVYYLLDAGELKRVVVDGAKMIRRRDLDEWLDGLKTVRH